MGEMSRYTPILIHPGARLKSRLRGPGRVFHPAANRVTPGTFTIILKASQHVPDCPRTRGRGGRPISFNPLARGETCSF
jgi:hypothetical protein